MVSQLYNITSESFNFFASIVEYPDNCEIPIHRLYRLTESFIIKMFVYCDIFYYILLTFTKL